MSDDATMARLGDQIAWYDRNSAKSQSRYKILKFTVILAAALIPLLSGSSPPFAPNGLPNWVLGAEAADQERRKQLEDRCHITFAALHMSLAGT